MQFRQESSEKKIKEFLILVENHKIDIRHFKSPVLVWGVQDGTAHYSFWENDILMRYGIENVDGWDFEEDLLFCPDWIAESEDEETAEDDEDDEDLGLICDLKITHKSKS